MEEDIVGKTLLNIILNEEKEEISQKVFLKLPLAQSVGKLIEFCCYVRKGKTGHLDAQHTYDYGYMYEEPDTYEYVKFTLYLQDSYDESFIFFGNYGPNSRSIWPSTPNFLHNQQYYLMGTISVLRTKTKSEHPVEIQPAVIVIESDDDSNIENYSFPLRTTKERMVHAFLPLVKKILILFKLKKTSVFIHEGKMRQKTEQHSLCGKGTYKVGRVPLWARDVDFGLEKQLNMLSNPAATTSTTNLPPPTILHCFGDHTGPTCTDKKKSRPSHLLGPRSTWTPSHHKEHPDAITPQGPRSTQTPLQHKPPTGTQEHPDTIGLEGPRSTQTPLDQEDPGVTKRYWTKRTQKYPRHHWTRRSQKHP
ncbi:hypothetical protein STEG23_022238 [Scotinomys teguina]